MTVVIDIGCHAYPAHPRDESIGRLVEMFQPVELHGFDPHPATRVGTWQEGATMVRLRRMAAWTYDGRLPFVFPTFEPLTARPGPGAEVLCFDLARWLHGWGERVVLKLDCEGSEYPLLEHLLARDVMGSVSRLLVEWHEPLVGPDDIPDDWRLRRDALLDALWERGVPVEPW